uniref:Protein kinase domain-containing protein n=1 Tax=Caenorhabditis tropicalis TaxID=1561998 RepID=A0A1I7TCP7_9PELO
MVLKQKFHSNPDLYKSLGIPSRCLSEELVGAVEQSPEKVDKEEEYIEMNHGGGNKCRMTAVGTGRFGTVFVGNADNTLIAVKTYHSEFHKRIWASNREGWELDIILKIQHPCILTHFEVVQCGSTVYKMMEYKPATLYDDINAYGKLSEERIKAVLVQLTRGLSYLHAQDVFHGTLHWKNIFITKDKVKIGDIESSAIIDWSPYHNTSNAILPFVAPELRNHRQEVTPECDLWSLGVVLFAMATGYTPFNASTREKLERNIANGHIHEPIWLSEKMRSLLKSMIRVNPDDRIPLDDLINDGWIVSDRVWEYLIDYQREAFEELRLTKKRNQSIVREYSKNSFESKDEGYNSSLASESPEPVALPISESSVQPEEDPVDPSGISVQVPKRFWKELAVCIMENVRPEVENIRHIETCRLKNGKLCLRITIPTAEDLPPSFWDRLQNRFDNLIQRLRPNQDAVVDLQFGDYALMSFGRNHIKMETGKNFPKFSSRKEAHLYFCRLDAENLWEKVGLSVCMRCRRAGTEAKKHDDDMCLYKLLTEATETDEIIFYGEEDQFNFRHFSLVYRNDGGRAGPLTRLRRGSMRILRSGCRRVVNQFRRQPSEQ